MIDQTTKDALIIAYRQVIEERYQYANLSAKYDLPASFDEARVNRFRHYFLAYIYPHPEQRRELDEAFASLDDYLKNPAKLMQLIVDSASLLFRFGRHLPKIMQAGIKALQSFRAASKFENQLIQQAAVSTFQPPFSAADIDKLLLTLDQTAINDFIAHTEDLFGTLHDRPLVAKIIEIVTALIEKMKQKPEVYSAVQVRGLEVGREIIVQGDALFDQLTETEQDQVFAFVVQVERDVLGRLFTE
ncbi:MAG: hypothetical protein AAGJ82_15870 [Bacteroidota bacterium]